MNIYKLEVTNSFSQARRFDSAVVAAKTEKEAINKLYEGMYSVAEKRVRDSLGWDNQNIEITLVGTANKSITEPTVIVVCYDSLY